MQDILTQAGNCGAVLLMLAPFAAMAAGGYYLVVRPLRQPDHDPHTQDSGTNEREDESVGQGQL